MNAFSCVSCISWFCYYLEQQLTAALKGPRISWTGLQDLKDLQDYVEGMFSLRRKYGRLVSATAKRVASPAQDSAQHVVDTLGSV